MTQQQAEPTADNFFDNVGGGGAPSAVLKALNDGVIGTIVSQRVVDHIPFGKTEPDTNKDGSIRKQLNVTLQTDLRDWQGVSRIPLIDRDKPDSPENRKPASEDDGLRGVYLPQWSNIQGAVADAVRKSNGGKPGPLADGAKLGVKVINLKDTGKGNPLKEHAAFYEAPAASAAFFEQAPATNQAPAQEAPAATQQPAQAAAPAAPAAQTDPWSGEAVTPSEPPF